MPTLEEAAKALREQRSQIINQGIMDSMPKMLAVGGAAGLGARGLLGLYNMARRNLTDNPRTSYTPYSPVVSEVPYPEEEENRKHAAWTPLPAPNFPPPPKPPKPPRRKTAGLLDTIGDETGKIFGGEYADSMLSHPLGPVALGGAGLAGTVGGYKLMDYLMKRQNKSQRQNELAKARQEYEQALLTQQEHKVAGEKTAAVKLGEELDRLADMVEKIATTLEKQGFGQQAISKALGMYLLTGGAVGALTGNATYNFFKKRQPAYVLDKALKQHRREMALQRPQPIYARPIPVTPGGGAAPNSMELNGDVLDEGRTEED